jgi:hypothetical protein
MLAALYDNFQQKGIKGDESPEMVCRLQSKKLATDGHFPYNPSPCEFPQWRPF